jgi:carotenoid 1,2-hydratase
VSHDGRFAIVVIALLGSPFSPAYARARMLAQAGAGPAPVALDYTSMNVAVYGPDRKLWALTETSTQERARTRDGVTIGRSSMRWDHGDLCMDLDETCAPLGRRLRGKVRVIPESQPALMLPLDARGAHVWWPAAPLSRMEVSLDEPNVRFQGHGYHDANAGDEPLGAAFARWSWSRARLGNRAIVTYDTVERGGASTSRALEIAANGAVADVELPHCSLPKTRWGMARSGRGEDAAVHRSLEDTPFYARALVKSRYQGEPVLAMHEELSCDRLDASWVRFLLGFRMRRRAA